MKKLKVDFLDERTGETQKKIEKGRKKMLHARTRKVLKTFSQLSVIVNVTLMGSQVGIQFHLNVRMMNHMTVTPQYVPQCH